MIGVPILAIAVPIVTLIAAVMLGGFAGPVFSFLFTALAPVGILMAIVMYYNFLAMKRKSLGRVLEAQRVYAPAA